MLTRLLCLIALCVGLAAGCAKPLDTSQADPATQAVQDLPTVELPAVATGDVTCFDMTACEDLPTLALVDGGHAPALALAVQPVTLDLQPQPLGYIMTSPKVDHASYASLPCEACKSALDFKDCTNANVVHLTKPVPFPRC